MFINQFATAEIIKDINISGNNRISKETLLVFSKMNIGDDLSSTDLNNILKDLYETNFFENVEIKLNNGILNITVIENPIIQTITIQGIRPKPILKAIDEITRLKEKNSYVDFLAEQDVNSIKSLLKSNGYYYADVNLSLIKNSNKTVNLIYDINLGDKVLIKRIRFTGEKLFKDRKLRNVIVSEEGKFWKFISNKKYLDQKRVELDMKLLKNYYINKGYYDVQIQNASAKLMDNKMFELTFNINAGKKYFFNDLFLQLPVDYEKDNFLKIEKLFKELKNESYSYSQIERILDQIDIVALDQQYEFINATVNEEIINGNKINFTFIITETEKFYVEKINILGNNITQESVIRNSLIVDEGDAFNEILNTKSINNLKAKGIFGTVKYKIIDGSTPNKKIVNISVTEKPTGEISLGAGVGSSGGTIGFGLKENNFLGKDIKLDSGIQISENSLRGVLSVTNPNFNYSDKMLKTTLQSTKVDKLTSSGYETSKLGVSIGTRYEQYENFFISPSISTHTEKIKTNSSASANYKKQEGNYFDSLLNYSLTFDKRNQRYQTSRGFVSTFNQSLPILSNNAAIVNGYEFRSYHEMAPEMITQFSIYGRVITSISDDDVRVSKRLFLPGRKLRGFEVGAVGPKDGDSFVGGNYATAVNIATSLPQLFPVLQNTDFSIFLDAGNVWGVDYSSSVDSSNKIRSSTGLAIDWYTPIGPLNFSLAAPLTKSSTDKTEGFRFNLGTTF